MQCSAVRCSHLALTVKHDLLPICIEALPIALLLVLPLSAVFQDSGTAPASLLHMTKLHFLIYPRASGPRLAAMNSALSIRVVHSPVIFWSSVAAESMPAEDVAYLHLPRLLSIPIRDNLLHKDIFACLTVCQNEPL